MGNVKWTGLISTDVSSSGNYTPAFPVNGDDLFVQDSTQNMSTNLTALQAISLNSINVSQTYSGEIGTTATSNNYLVIAATTINVGYQYGGTAPGSGSDLIRLNNGTNQYTANITNSGATSALANAGPITILGTHTANTLNIVSGTVSVAQDPTETAAVRTINNGGNLFLGTGVTLNTLSLFGGSMTVRSNAGTITVSAGGLTTAGSATITLLQMNGGNAALNSSGTITTMNVQAATVDMSGDPRSKTVTNCTLYSGAQLNINNGVKSSIVFTNNITVLASAGQYTLTPWPNTNLALS